MGKDKFKDVQLLAPAGSFEALRAAISAGADAVYFGVDKLNMRARAANNFSLRNLKKVVSLLHENNMRAYLTLNVVVYDDELKDVLSVLKKAKEARVDAIIASDFAIITKAKEIGILVHVSTQANVSNVEALSFFSAYADVVVLARELSLDKIKKINKEIIKKNIRGPSGNLMRLEVFIHGALCVSISGKCYMSLAKYNHSANRGDCLQPCRRKYRVFDEETKKELIVDNDFVMSPSDLCTIESLPLLLDAGASVLKIEGRGRSPEYVYEVVRAYREAINLIRQKKYTKSVASSLKTRLKKVFNRGFWEGGYYLGSKINEWANTYGSKASHKKLLVGKVTNYYSKKNVASILVESNSFKKGDSLIILGPTTGIINFVCEGIQKESSSINVASKGELVSVIVPSKVRKNDKVYVQRKS